MCRRQLRFTGTRLPWWPLDQLHRFLGPPDRQRDDPIDSGCITVRVACSCIFCFRVFFACFGSGLVEMVFLCALRGALRRSSLSFRACPLSSSLPVAPGPPTRNLDIKKLFAIFFIPLPQHSSLFLLPAFVGSYLDKPFSCSALGCFFSSSVCAAAQLPFPFFFVSAFFVCRNVSFLTQRRETVSSAKNQTVRSTTLSSATAKHGVSMTRV